MGNLKTPDPLFSSEQIGALVVTILGNLYVLFGFEGLSDAQHAALITLINSLFVVGSLVHALYVRGKRAQAVGNSQSVITLPPDGDDSQIELPQDDPAKNPQA